VNLIKTYRKKPVVVAALQFLGGTESATALINWILESGHTATYREGKEEQRAGNGEICQMADPEHIRIRTLEGTMRAEKGDWIIRGIKGEFYPCKPDIFAATYDAERDFSGSNTEIAIRDTKQFRKDLDGVLSELKQAASPQFNPNAPDSLAYPPGYRHSSERANAIMKIQEAIMWLGMDLKAINEEEPGASPNPYPQSYNPDS
jgi:hypothetical protein